MLSVEDLHELRRKIITREGEGGSQPPWSFVDRDFYNLLDVIKALYRADSAILANAVNEADDHEIPRNTPEIGTLLGNMRDVNTNHPIQLTDSEFTQLVRADYDARYEWISKYIRENFGTIAYVNGWNWSNDQHTLIVQINRHLEEIFDIAHANIFEGDF